MRKYEKTLILTLLGSTFCGTAGFTATEGMPQDKIVSSRPSTPDGPTGPIDEATVQNSAKELPAEAADFKSFLRFQRSTDKDDVDFKPAEHARFENFKTYLVQVEDLPPTELAKWTNDQLQRFINFEIFKASSASAAAEDKTAAEALQTQAAQQRDEALAKELEKLEEAQAAQRRLDALTAQLAQQQLETQATQQRLETQAAQLAAQQAEAQAAQQRLDAQLAQQQAEALAAQEAQRVQQQALLDAQAAAAAAAVPPPASNPSVPDRIAGEANRFLDRKGISIGGKTIRLW